MIASLPTSRPRKPLGVIPALITVSLISSPLIIKNQLDLRSRAEAASEYQSASSFFLSKIEAAVENQDLETLRRIHGRFAGCVADGAFKSAINGALAKVAAREAEVELAVSKHLDWARHKEEAGTRQVVSQPRQEAEGENDRSSQQLSVLPR